MVDRKQDSKSGYSRREFIKGAGVAASGSTLLLGKDNPAVGASESEDQGSGIRRIPGSGQILTLEVNGVKKSLHVTPNTTLLHVLRESLDLTGSKEVCDRGSCGACTVLLDGRSVNSCMLLAFDAEGKSITTVEGLSKDNQLDPVQKAFVENDACQCGYCIPGFVMRTRALLNEKPQLSKEDIKSGLSGNICRCAAYSAILSAVEQAAQGGN
ncbi:(2Fe-2S)-binding protein [Bythopirellula goksoeyrii]|uniref:Putative xanthine dehydrogenase subunit E n=1 Tax=Bythopirellula goksoeyrii TaxID=1400387 RepID=A0A5B9QI64_9BACT|nr:(2Fe-2S)-binding protein [Bythopirellula goksoeyrii]QEG33911.1 putative xanthine dehydrogenase subunit E [Bythopirellula goksoeyrii]